MREEFLRRAIALASLNVSSGRGGPFGAVIEKDGRILAEGANLVTSTHDPTAHAEVVAVREACRILQTHSLEGCTLYASCEPCPMCLSAIYWARISKLVYAATKDDAAAAGFDDSFLYHEVALPPSARALPAERGLPSEASAPFDLWRSSMHKIPY
jgi:tRNA(Arg) A34 adenosine deaminase TadA